MFNYSGTTVQPKSNMEDLYCKMYENTLTHLERKLYHLRNPEDLVLGTLKAICEFYQADWSGILDADLQLGVWTPIWWYSAKTKAM